MTGSDSRTLTACRDCALFPLADRSWADFASNNELRGADDGEAGRGGWHFRRSTTHVHRGIDLKAPIGLPVLAVQDGTAEYLAVELDPHGRPVNMAGHRVRLAGRDGAGYRYFHLGTVHTDTADAFPRGIAHGDLVEVRAGDVLGFLGHTGGSAATGAHVPAHAAHLHFQYHPGGLDSPDVNPARLFERVCPVHAARPAETR